MKLFKNKKATVFEQLKTLAVGIAVLAITLTVAFLVMSQGKDQIGDIEDIDVDNLTQCETSVACNATSTMQEATGDIPGWVPLIVIAFIGAILLSLVGMFKSR